MFVVGLAYQCSSSTMLLSSSIALTRHTMNNKGLRQSPCRTPMVVAMSSPISLPTLTLRLTF